MPDDPRPDRVPRDSTSGSGAGERSPTESGAHEDSPPGSGARESSPAESGGKGSTPSSEEGTAGGDHASAPEGDHSSVPKVDPTSLPWWAGDGSVSSDSEDWSPDPETGSSEEDPTPQTPLPPDEPSAEENREPATPSTEESRKPATPSTEKSPPLSSPSTGEEPAATSPLRVVKQPSQPRKRLSPILIPGEPTSSTPSRIRRWLGQLLEGKRTSGTSRRVRASGASRPANTPSLSPPAGAPDGTLPVNAELTAPDEEASSLGPTDQLDSAAPHSTSDQLVHRATTQLLPGRLQPLNPDVIQQEVRFLTADTPGGTQSVTLGWDLGDPPEHVTLDHPSIQPLHARMIYQRGHWMIETLTDIDPLEINEALILPLGVPYLLSHGDEIRIGKALFRFVQS